MQEVVSTYIVGHCAASRLVDNSHVNYATQPPNIVDVNEGGIPHFILPDASQFVFQGWKYCLRSRMWK